MTHDDLDHDAASRRLEVKLLGPMDVRHQQQSIDLPQSKKTRALLAYLAVTGKSHRRDRLCALLWDVTDDPRGALRWSLSRLRRVLDRPQPVIVADRESAGLDLGRVDVDVRQLLDSGHDLHAQPTERLEHLAGLSQGEFLEGLELADFHDFHAWCVAMREEVRERRRAILSELAERLSDDPRRALPHVRAWVRFDPLDVTARITLLRMLLAVDKTDEARQNFELGCRVLRDLDPESLAVLRMAWRDLSHRGSSGSSKGDIGQTPSTRPEGPSPSVAPTPTLPALPERPFVGREKERAALQRLLEEAQTRGSLRVALLTGEPGAGKSRLSEVVLAQASQRQMKVLRARAFDADIGRPFGPWADALQGAKVTPDTEAGQGTPEAHAFATGGEPSSREAVFAAVAEAVAAASHPKGVLVLLDDVQWLDQDSAELLQYVVRMNIQRPVFVLLNARSGELADNDPVLRALRALRRETRVDEVALQPLGLEDLQSLVGAVGADIDPARLREASAGNPLYALELLQSVDATTEGPPRRLVDLVRDRLDRLPPEAGDVLRWAAILGYTFDLSRLEGLCSLSMEAMVDAVELLERHALLVADESGRGMRYQFAHDVVREAIYGDLSHPRRRLMHRRVAQFLEPHMDDPSTATEIAHHAGLARDADLGVRACIRAAHRSLRVFANADAQALARRGLHLVEDLDEPDRVAYGLELLQALWSAKQPDRAAAAARARELTDRALALGLTPAARLGFHMLAHLEWERGSMADAHRNMMEAERISRTSDPAERATALAEAARCLVLLERNLEQAQAFVYEVNAMMGDEDRAPMHAVAFTQGALQAHRGALEQAREAFAEARGLARQAGDRLAEFQALEHTVMLEIDDDRLQPALRLTEELRELGGRVREGSEAAGATALHALCAWLDDGGPTATVTLDRAIEALARVDAKQRLCFVCGRYAVGLLARDDPKGAQREASRVLELASVLDRPTEIARAHLLLARIARADGAIERLDVHLQALRDLDGSTLPARLHQELSSVLDKG